MTLRRIVPIALLTALALGVHARPAHPAVADTLGLPYVSDIDFEPEVLCPGQPVRLVVRGEFPNSCGRVQRTDADSVTIFVRTAHPQCGDCLAEPRPWSAEFDLGVLAAGHFSVRLTIVESDSTCDLPPRVIVHQATVEFDVPRRCPPPDPLRFLQGVSITSANPSHDRICPGDSILVRLGGTFPDDCHWLRRVELMNTVIVGPTPGPPTVRLVFDTGCCLGRVCRPGPVPWDAAVVLPPLATGYYALNVEGIEVCCRDTVVAEDPYGTRAFQFRITTPDSCGTDTTHSCLMAFWDHSGRIAGCDAGLAGDRTAALTLMLAAGEPLAGFQGAISIHADGGAFPPGLRVTGVEAVGPAAGMHVAWEPRPDGASFVLFADAGAPIPGRQVGIPPSPVVRFKFASAANDSAGVARWHVTAHDLLGSDEHGGGVPMCRIDTFALEAGNICAGGRCDLNGDAHADVRDLVLMVHCFQQTGPCPADPVASLDCDADQDFDLDDVMCCARRVLIGPECRHCGGDSTRAEPAIAVQFGDPVRSESGYDIPVRLERADHFAAARLVFRMPDALASGARVTLDPAAAGWLEVDESRPGERVVGLVDLAPLTKGHDVTTLLLTLHVPVPADPSAQITVGSAEFSAADGVLLTADLGDPAVRIGGGVSLSLGPVAPNPFTDRTEFRVSLDAAADIELGVYDLAGRRVARLHEGRLGLGVHRFSWDGRADEGGRAPAGVYFLRAGGPGTRTVRKLVLVKGE